MSVGQGDNNTRIKYIGYADSSFRAPLFYDSDNTAYYTDPASTSNLNTLLAQDFKTIFISGSGGHSFAANHYSMGKDIANSGWSHPHYSDLIIGYHTGIRLGANYSGIRFYNNSPTTDANNDGNGDGGEALLMTVGGYVGTASYTDVVVNNNLFANASMRSPIFYDSNDTGYYTDPASTSNLYNLQLTGAKHTYLYINPGNGNEAMVRYNGGTGSGWYVGKRTSSQLIGTDNFHFYSEAVAATVGGIDSSGNMIVTGSHQAPIFYDSNNTGYYTNPASNTTLYGNFQVSGDHGGSQIGVRLLSANNGAGTGEVNLRMWCSEPGVTWDNAGFGYNVTNDGGSPGGFGRMNAGFGQAYMRFTAGGTLVFYNTNTSGTRYTNMELYADNTVYINNYATGGNSLRAPIFYDSNDTAYYTDPASTSNLNILSDPALSDSKLYLRTKGDTNHYLWNNASDFEEMVYYTGTGFRVTSSVGTQTALFSESGLNVTGNVTATNYYGNGANLTGISAGLSVSDDTSTNATRYILFDDATSGTISAINVSSSKLTFNPSTGTLSATQFTSTSDERVKTNIRPITNALDITEQLSGVRFNWKENNISSLGLIAQEVEKVLPEVVNTDSEDMKSINYSSLVSLLVEAIKEQQTQINQLKDMFNHINKSSN
jgi:hypothetical protein